jgi:hypothetical protein
MPFTFDGLTASLDFLEVPVVIRYSVKEGNYSPKTVKINGENIGFSYEENPYRKGGAIIKMNDFMELLNEGGNDIQIEL